MSATETGNVSPLEIRQHPYGWTVTCLDESGHIRHVATADNEIQAYRAARKLAGIYRLQGRARVSTPRGDYFLDLAAERNNGSAA
ncbi:MAG: hypothetical protein AB7U81_03510 [Thiohalomonadaceae bacterium]